MKNMTVSEKLLMAAYSLSGGLGRQFTAEDLVVSAWTLFPSTFGLAGYKDADGKLKYPDSNRVFAEIMGTKPIRKKGHLEKVGRKMYQLTSSGVEAARRFDVTAIDSESHETQKSGMSRVLKKQLADLIRCRAVVKVDNGQLDELSFQDACMFWGINPRSKAIELEGKLSHFRSLIRMARDEATVGKVSLAHGGSAFGLDTLALLERTADILEKRFQQDLNVIKSRTDQRKR